MEEQESVQPLAVGKRLYAFRRRAELSLEGLAERCGVSKSMLSKIERGESIPTVAAAVRIAMALSVPLEQLLGLDARAQVRLLPMAHQEVLADPRSGTTRYQLTRGHGTTGAVRVERLVMPPGARPLRLPEVGTAASLLLTVSRGRLDVAVGLDTRHSMGAGDCLTVRGEVAPVVLPCRDELAEAYLVWLAAPSDGG